MARDDRESNLSSDQTAVNRATYDRIAGRYVENHKLHVSSGASLFFSLEETFLSKMPISGLVADVGCGPGFDAARFETRGFRAIGIDLSAGMLDVASEGLSGRLVQADMRTLPISSGQLDGIWCVASLLHVPDVDTIRVLREFKRVLRSSGVLALVTASGESSNFEAVPYVPGEQRWFVYRDAGILKGQMLAAGFSITLEGQIQGNRVWSTFLAEAI
ncbi:MAG TPA: class I SAM-dependent methyltransferase [Acidimicrobiales bacterium]|nr:class I SAM-dependent methyltransferase [Acidimicrobiales bacterium]